MKVVQINCTASGSTGNIAKAIHKQLLKDGNESYIFYEGGTPTEENMLRIGNYFGLHSHAVLSRNLGRQGYFSRFSTLKLIKRLKKIQPDIIHLHNLHGSYLNLPMLFRYLKKAKSQIVITLHDCWLFTGKCPYFTVAKCYKWKEECGNCPQLVTYPRSKIDTTKKCLADKKKWLSGFDGRMNIYAVSKWLRDTAKESFLSKYPIKTIYNGINTEVFRPLDGTSVKNKYGLNNKFIILGVAFAWDKRKGLDEFLELSENLTEDEVIVLVGLTAEQTRKMPPNIIGITRTEDQEELAQLYSAADVFVSTSKEETFGLVTAEAMACSTPVIVYNLTACGEIVTPDCGIVREENEALRGAINKIKEMGLKDKGVSLSENLETGVMVRSYIDEYNRIKKAD